MSTLLLRLAAPLQAWGTESKFEIRRTGSEPTKSGVVGLLMAALGCRRDDTEMLQRLTKLRMGVRVDQQGETLRDYHTAHDEKGTPYLSNRFYLSDAVFVVGLEEEDADLLQKLEQALLTPAFPLFLGRRACPPTLPIVLGIRPLPLLQALQQEPWQTAPWRQRKQIPSLRLVVEGGSEGEIVSRIRDLPLSFNPMHRDFGYRFGTEAGWVTPVEYQQTQHDAMQELMGGEADVSEPDGT